MKKVVKGFIIAAVALIVVGILIFAGGMAVGGIAIGDGVFREAVERYENSRLKKTIHTEYEVDFVDETDDAVFVSGEELEFPAAEVKNLKVKSFAVQILIEESEDTDVITVFSDDTAKIRLKKGNLLIESSVKSPLDSANSANQIIIKIPTDFQFHEADIFAGEGAVGIDNLNADSFELETGVGAVEIHKLTAKEADFEVGLGEVIVRDGNVRNCDVEVGVGRFEYEGVIYDGSSGEYAESSVDCGMGSAEFYLQGSPEDYNYEIECAAGSVVVGDESYSGIAKEKYINHRAKSEFEINCAAGEVKVMF